jgi:NOL1/NOP2/fmu family ribosome biogenesis protein
MKIEIMNKSKKEDFLKELSYLGDFKMNELFLSAGPEQVRIYSGHLHVDDILKIWRIFPIEGVGLYFGKKITDRHGQKEARLSTDALHLLGDKITRNIIDINAEQVDKWFRGNNVELTDEQKAKYKLENNFVAVRFGTDFVGTAKLNAAGILISFLPKERRIY